MKIADDMEMLPYIGTWDLSDARLNDLCVEVLGRIPNEFEDDFPVINVQQRDSAWGAHVEDENVVVLDEEKLARYSRAEAIGIIAHELSHVYLQHPKVGGLEDEYSADDLASGWGLDLEVHAMREAIGPPTVR